MILPDVNVLAYAHREDCIEHSRVRPWLEAVLDGDVAYGYSELVLSGFVRIVTHPRIFSPPSPLGAALAYAEVIRSQPQAVCIHPGPRHWGVFARLCREAGARGNLIPDAYLAALAIESGCEWISTDGDYARFPGLNWQNPFRDSTSPGSR